jgi:hypothetical protein
MAAEGERASRREHVIAVVAIVVTGVVSAAGVVVGCETSRDAQRTAREAQREAARAQRGQADLTELRSVLDRATADLSALREAMGDLSEPNIRPQSRVTASESIPTRVLARFQDTSRDAEASLARLLIRLGPEAKASRYFRSAVTAYRAAGTTFIFILGRDARRAWRISSKYSSKGGEAESDFIAAARKLVGSQLPE